MVWVTIKWMLFTSRSTGGFCHQQQQQHFLLTFKLHISSNIFMSGRLNILTDDKMGTHKKSFYLKTDFCSSANNKYCSHLKVNKVKYNIQQQHSICLRDCHAGTRHRAKPIICFYKVMQQPHAIHRTVLWPGEQVIGVICCWPFRNTTGCQ